MNPTKSKSDRPNTRWGKLLDGEETLQTKYVGQFK
jgi:hypothetical protein